MTVPPPRAKMPVHAAHKAGAVSPNEQAVLWTMEEQFWMGSADNARATTAENAVMVFPYPPGILQGDQIWIHLRQPPGWRSAAMSERRVTRFGAIVILTYRIAAAKLEMSTYKALCATTYLRDEEVWLRVFHQRTLAK